MKDCKNILVAIQSREDARILLPKAKRLVQTSNATVHAVTVAYEGLAEVNSKDVETLSELKNFIMQEEETALKEAIATSGTSIPNLQTATLWGRKSWEAILYAAEAMDVGLIIKAEEETNNFRRIRPPDDWNLLRESNIPVLLCGSKKWSSAPELIAAVDVYDNAHLTLNVRLLRQADALAEALTGHLQVVSAFPSLEPWTPSFATFRNYQKMMADIEKDAKHRLASMLDYNDMKTYPGLALEGNPDSVIQQVAEEVDADILIMGTSARTGIQAVVLGNTAEKLLHKTKTDVLTVP